MSTIALYANKINNMPGYISDMRKSVGDFKSELFNLKSSSLAVNKNICNLDDVISNISATTQIQEQKIAALEDFQKKSEQFIEDTIKIDSNVADVVNQSKKDFYNEYSYLKPDCEKNGWEKFCDGCQKAAEWCKEHWVMIVTVLIVITVAIIAVVTFGVAIAAIAAIAGIVSLVLCISDVVCMLATGGKGISDVCRENGLCWLGEIFDGISLGCDIVSIAFPAGAAIKTMAKVGVKSFVKGSIRAMKVAFKGTFEKVFKSGFRQGLNNFGKIMFKTFIFDIDDFSRVNSNGKRVLDIFDHTPNHNIPKDIPINNGGLNPDGTVKYKADGTIDWPERDGFSEKPVSITLEPGTRIDRFGYNGGFFVSPEGTPYKNRALSPGTNNKPYTAFDVIQPINNVDSGSIASYFNQPGGGLQFKLPDSIQDLLDSGKIKIRNYGEIVLKGFTQTGYRNTMENL